MPFQAVGEIRNCVGGLGMRSSRTKWGVLLARGKALFILPASRAPSGKPVQAVGAARIKIRTQGGADAVQPEGLEPP